MTEQLPHFEAIRAKVKYFNGQKSGYPPEVVAVLSSLQQMIREKNFEEMLRFGESFSKHDVVLANPKVLSLLGQACAELGPDYKEKARAYFRQAEGIGYHDSFMMRRWYNMEINYNLPEAERICAKMIELSPDNPRTLSEFWSKQGQCILNRANSILSSSRDKALLLLRDSFISYSEGAWIASSARIETPEGAYWTDRPLQRLASLMGQDLEQTFLLIEQLAQRRHDVTIATAQSIIRHIRLTPAPTTDGSRKRLRSHCLRSCQGMARILKDLDKNPGFRSIYDELMAIHDLV